MLFSVLGILGYSEMYCVMSKLLRIRSAEEEVASLNGMERVSLIYNNDHHRHSHRHNHHHNNNNNNKLLFTYHILNIYRNML